MLKYWSGTAATKYLSPTDVALAIEICGLLAADDSPVRVLEVGIWQGAWLLTLARNTEGITAWAGIDPFPGQPWLRGDLLRKVEDQELTKRFSLFGSWQEMGDDETRDRFELIHVDGDHTEHGAGLDLLEASKVLSERGVIAVDDVCNPYYPGVASALHDFLRSQDYAVFLQTANKVYLCRSVDHSSWYARLDDHLGQSPLIIEHYPYELEASPPPYIERPTVQGRNVLLCLDRRNNEIALFGSHRRFRSLVKDLVPPAAAVMAQRMLRVNRK